MTGLLLELEESAISARRGRNGGSVLTRDQSDWNDAAKIEQSLFQKNTTLKTGGNTDVAALPIEHSLLGWAIEAKLYHTQNDIPKKPLPKNQWSILKLQDNCNVE